MSLYDAYAAADSSFGWRAEAAARLREFVERRLSPAGRGVEYALKGAERAIERVVENGLTLRHVRASLRALSAWIGRRGVAADGAVNEELEKLCASILESPKDGLENYPAHLFTVDLKF